MALRASGSLDYVGTLRYEMVRNQQVYPVIQLPYLFRNSINGAQGCNTERQGYDTRINNAETFNSMNSQFWINDTCVKFSISGSSMYSSQILAS